eukprot:g8375.t1
MSRDESLERFNAIDAICDRFESAFLSGDAPAIEAVLAEHPDVDRTQLLRELLLIELEMRRTHGETPAVEEYASRFPDQTDVIDDALHSVAEKTADLDETCLASDPSETETIVYTPGERPDSLQAGGKQFGDYELLHEIARGGMGVVYKARQTKLNRIVALKMIKSGELAGDEEVKRFHAEAEAAAALDHPGIVPIYEVGQHNDQHFFSMGFVDGAGLDAQLKEGPLPPKDAAGLIKTIAEAVQYAHDKGIVHRDLKPANVLLADAAHPVDAQSGAAQQIGANQTEPGRAAPGHNDSPTTAVENPSSAARAGTARLFAPRITDFGLAKNIAGDSGMTATGQVLGTPSYMPPEQAAGKIEQVGPLADVYSLGAMLYATLTGRPPFQSANVMETLKQVLEREPVSPSQLNPAVDKDLETICLKCLEKDAAKRYPTARDFASDLECYLTGKPISARPISRPARVWRWCKRNPLGATVAGLLLFLAIAGPAVAVHQVDTNRRLDAALSGEKDATATAQTKEQETAEALEKVKAALVREQAALKRKDRALLETEDAIARYVAAVTNATLLKEPRLKPLLRLLLKDALVHFQSFIDRHKHEQDMETRARMGSALAQIGSINRRIGTNQAAIDAFEQSRALFEKLTSTPSGGKEYERSLSDVLNELAVLYELTGEPEKSLRDHRRAVALRKRLAERHSGDPQYERRVAASLLNLGALLSSSGKESEALKAYQQAIEIQQRLVDQQPAVAERRHELAVTYHNLAVLYHNTNQPRRELESHKRARAIREILVANEPSNADFQHNLAQSLRDIGALHQNAGRTQQAADAYRQALKILQPLAQDNPAVKEYQRTLGRVEHSLGTLLLATGKTDEAQSAFQRAIRIRTTLVNENPAEFEFRIELANSLSQTAVAFNRQRKVDDAIGEVNKALAVSQPPDARPFQNDEFVELRARLHASAGKLLEQKQQFAEAVKSFETSAAILTKRIQTTPVDADFRRELGKVRHRLGSLYRRQDRRSTSLEQYRSARDIRDALSRAKPAKAGDRSDLARTLDAMAIVFAESNQPAEALSALQDALKLRRELVKEHPDDLSHQSDLSDSHQNLAVFYVRNRDSRKALQAYEQSATIREVLVSKDPKSESYQSGLAESLGKLGLLYETAKRRTDALKAYRRALRLRERLLQAEPQSPTRRYAVAYIHNNLGIFYKSAGDRTRALKHFTGAFDLLDSNNASDSMEIAGRGKGLLRNVCFNRALTFEQDSRYREAAADYQQALSLDEGRLRTRIEDKLCRVLAFSGAHADAAALVGQLVHRNVATATEFQAMRSGVLHKANESALGNRQLVVKFLKDSSRQKEFQKEIEVTAKLDHPGVVAVFTQGVEKDHLKRPFFGMRLVHGEQLDERIAKFHNRLRPKTKRQRSVEFTPAGGITELIDHIVSTCNTISHAHSMGVLHCDLKPKNIACGRFGATIVLDWGSASSCDVAPEELHDSTPPIDLPDGSTSAISLAYASPEQVAVDEKAPLSPASDVYSIGATLYQALTGSAPFDSRRTRDSIAPNAREVNPLVPKRLSAICAKAMALAPEQRYQSPRAFAADLTNWLRDEPIQAVSDNLIDRTFRVARRHQGATFALVCMLVVVLVSGGLISAFMHQRREAQQKQQETSRSLDLTLDLIDGVCEPLANDEVKNLKEFDEIATKVEEFTTDFILNKNSGENRQLARVHKFKGIIQFYYYTRDPNNQDKNRDTILSAEDRKSKLQAAIDQLEIADELLGDDERLPRAKIRLMLARWKWQMSALVEDGGTGESKSKLMSDSIQLLDGVLTSLKKLTGWNVDSVREARQVDMIRAEAHHLLAVYLKDRAQSRNAVVARDDLQRSVDSFGAAIRILQRLHETNSGDALIKRNLARAFGFRGDLFSLRGEVDKAIADYGESLIIRKELDDGTVVGSDNHVESRFQLARGYTNFGMLLCEFGDAVPLTAVFADMPRLPGESNEDYVLRTCVEKAIAIQEVLLKNGDKRFASDLVWSLNVAAELHLAAAERANDPEELTRHLKHADRHAERAIVVRSAATYKELESSGVWSRTKNELGRSDERQLATSLMLKLRIIKALVKSGEAGTPAPEVVVKPDGIIELARENESLDQLREEDLLNFAVAWAAKSQADPSFETEMKQKLASVVSILRARRFRKAPRLRNHLIGVGLKPEVADADTGRLQFENLTDGNAVHVGDDTVLFAANGPQQLTLPVRLSMANCQIEFEPLVQTLAQTTRLLTDFPAGFHLTLTDKFGELETAEFVSFINAVTTALQLAVDENDLCQRACDAIKQLIDVDGAAVFRSDNWTRLAGDADLQPHFAALERVKSERRVTWRNGGYEDAEVTAPTIDCYVASPIVTSNTATSPVYAVIYAHRGRGSIENRAPLSEVQARLVELVACTVGAGIARTQLEQQSSRFGGFFPPALAKKLIAGDDILRALKTEVTLLFCDIRGFSSICEGLEPETASEWIEDVLSALSQCVQDFNGVLVDYMGDELLAMWGAPEVEPRQAELACRAALAMIDSLPAVNEKWKPRIGAETRVGIGINSGKASVGNSGSRQRFKYSPLGDAVNRASRVQGLTKHLRIPILLTADTRNQLPPDLAVRRLGQAKVVNIEHSLELFELLTPPRDAAENYDDFEQAIQNLEGGEFRQAAELLQPLLDFHTPDHPTLLLFNESIRRVIDGSPREGFEWDFQEK